jgi:hypothetical protein
LRISEVSYGLLIWMGSLVEAGRVSIEETKQILASPESAMSFLTGHRDSLPTEFRPPEGGVQETANVLGSYLRVSFDLDDTTRRTPDLVCGPTCPWCWTVKTGPHLSPKKTTSADRHKADRLAVREVGRLAESGAVDLDEAAVQQVSVALKRESGLLAYADQLVARVDGATPGTEALVLWRRFAWDGGSPIKGFRLTPGDVEMARQVVLAALRSTATV